ncbi:MAG: glycosyltransferase family 4 protein [Chloroflexota bacterium]
MKVGYLWQIEDAKLNQVTASPLHIKAVIKALEKRDHCVRFVTTPEGIYQYSDDWDSWTKIPMGFYGSRIFKFFRSGIGFLQTKLKLPYFHFFDSLRYAGMVIKTCKDFDVFYERYWLLNYGGLIASKWLGAPLILEINGDVFKEYEMLGIELSDRQWRVIHWLNRRLFHMADHVVTVSEPLRQKWIERFDLPPEKVTAIDNGAHVDLFAADYELSDLKAKYSLNGEPIAAFVGTFRLWHGLDLVVDAFEAVAKAHPKAKLLLIGDGPQYDEIQQLVADKGLSDRVVFTGKLPHSEVPKVLKLAQVALVNPKLSPASAAQSPLKLFEYMAGGKAVIAPNVPNIQKVVSHGENGLLIPPNDSEALSAAMLSSLSDPELCEKLGKKAQAKALAEFSWDTTVEKIELIMNHLLDGQQK